MCIKENKKDHLPARSNDSMNRDKWGQEMVFAYLVYTIIPEKIQEKNKKEPSIEPINRLERIWIWGSRTVS